MNDEVKKQETIRLDELRSSDLSSIKLFIAADIPSKLEPALRTLQNNLAKTLQTYSTLEFTPQKTFHVTLVYFGEQSLENLESIIQLFHETQRHFSSQVFTISLDESTLQLFGNAIARERVRLQRMKRGAALATTLTSDLVPFVQSLTERGKEFLKHQHHKPFVPHLTLGRIKLKEQSLEELQKHETEHVIEYELERIKKYAATLSVPKLESFHVPSITLFESQGSETYVPLVTYTLQS